MRVDWKRGLNAGLGLSPIMFIVDLALVLLYSEVFLRIYGGYTYYWNFPSPSETIIWIMEILITVVIVCTITGVLFAFLKEKLPGQRDQAKGVYLFLPIWSLYIIYVYLVESTFMQGMPLMPAFLMVWIVPSIGYGYLLGYYWDRAELTEEGAPPRF